MTTSVSYHGLPLFEIGNAIAGDAAASGDFDGAARSHNAHTSAVASTTRTTAGGRSGCFIQGRRTDHSLLRRRHRKLHGDTFGVACVDDADDGLPRHTGSGVEDHRSRLAHPDEV